jgi:hypothetical protein
MVGSIFWAARTSIISLWFCILAAFLWEIFEKFAEKNWTHIWLDPESWYNSWISDPLTCVVGFLGIWWLLDHRKRKNDKWLLLRSRPQERR